MAEKQDEELKFWIILIVAIILFIAIVIYVTSLGNVDIGVKGSFPAEFKEDRQKAFERHKRLKALVDKQIELKKKLDRRFRNIYLTQLSDIFRQGDVSEEIKSHEAKLAICRIWNSCYIYSPTWRHRISPAGTCRRAGEFFWFCNSGIPLHSPPPMTSKTRPL